MVNPGGSVGKGSEIGAVLTPENLLIFNSFSSNSFSSNSFSSKQKITESCLTPTGSTNRSLLRQNCCPQLGLIGTIVMVTLVLFQVLAVVFGVCTAAGCVGVTVGGGCVIGASFLLCCVMIVFMILQCKQLFGSGLDKNKSRDQKFICVIGAILMANLSLVIVGILSVSGIVSPVAGGAVAAVVSPILLGSIWSAFLLISRK